MRPGASLLVATSSVEHPQNLMVVARARMSEWPDAMMVRDVHVCPMLEQQCHDLLMARTTIRQDDRFQQRSPAQAVDVVHVDPRLGQEITHHLDMTALGCREKGGAAEAIGDRRIG